MATKKKLDSNSNRLTFHYVKSNQFRVIRADGAWGGVTPRLEIQMSVFSERLPLPEFDEMDISEVPAKPIRTGVKTKGLIREVESAILMSSSTARSLAQWLADKADQVDKIKAEAEAGDSKPASRKVK
jgi:hypothetical protein